MGFEENLKQNKMKVTPQRVAILREIEKMGHATIDEVYENILKDYPSISLATIYKNITSLCETGILKEVKVSMQKQKYELNCTDHAHIICTQCGKLEDLELDLSRFYTDGKVVEKITPTCASVAIYGKCIACQGKKSTN